MPKIDKWRRAAPISPFSPNSTTWQISRKLVKIGQNYIQNSKNNVLSLFYLKSKEMCIFYYKSSFFAQLCLISLNFRHIWWQKVPLIWGFWKRAGLPKVLYGGRSFPLEHIRYVCGVRVPLSRNIHRETKPLPTWEENRKNPAPLQIIDGTNSGTLD